MPTELVEEEEKVAVVVPRVELDLALGLAAALALVRVVWHQPLVAMGLPLLTVVVGARAKVLVQMGLAEKEPERAVVKDLVRVAWQQLLLQVISATLMPPAVVPVVAAETVEMVVEKEVELERPATTALQAVPVARAAATVAA